MCQSSLKGDSLHARRFYLNKSETASGYAMDSISSGKLTLSDLTTQRTWDGGIMASVRQGYGTATAHHGELFQGVVRGADLRLHYGLISLPCGIFQSEATFIPDSTGKIKVTPDWKIKALKAAELTLASIDPEHHNLFGGQLQIHSNIPVGWGLGSSSSDVTAAIRAVADSFQRKLCAKEIALLAVKAETASDSVMFGEDVVVFAQREGMVLEELGGVLPELEVLGFNTDPTGSGIDTLGVSPVDYSWWEIEAFRPMLGLLRHAVRTQNPRLLGQVACASAYINQQHLPKPHFEQLERLKNLVSAVGLQVAHSGTVVGLLFEPAGARTDSRIKLAQTLIEEMGFGKSWYFQIKNPGRGDNGVSR
jgi:uncharacterized protein involved in propanediol utilization